MIINKITKALYPLKKDNSVKINRLCKSITASTQYNQVNKGGRKKNEKGYYKKSFASAKKINMLCNVFYESRDKQKKFIWTTITTCQHKTGLTDKELIYRLKLWLQHQSIRYINVVERQRETGDVHFHLIIEKEKYFDIKVELYKLARLFECESHPALFEVKAIKNVKMIISYIRKYVTKKGQKPTNEKPLYSSLFKCRTLSYSQGINKLFKQNYSHYVIELPYTAIQLLNLELLHKSDFFCTYKYSVEKWNLAHKLNLN